MCGVAGIFHYGTDVPIDHDILNRMTSRLAHRGPDGEGFFIDGNLGLGHRRLSIIDREGGRQPLSNESGDVWVSFNGEIYNHAELRRELKSKGHLFRSKSDTEVLVHLYEEHGIDFVHSLNGMFAIALWDSKQRRLYLIRDRLGIKPLYYYDSGSWLAFASELSGLLQHPQVPRRMDPQAVLEFLNYEYVAAPATLLRNAHKLAPAQYLTVGLKGPPRASEYWVYPREELCLTEADAIDRFRELFALSVKRRLMSDVPLGAFLSGGLDSSAIVSEMVQSSVDSVKTFTVGFEDESYDESRYARDVARQFGCDHTEIILRPDPVSWVDQALENENEPLGDFSLIPTTQVCKLAREDVAVCLSGDGADELLAGYERHLASHLDRRFLRWLPKTMRQHILSQLAGRMPVSARKKTVSDMMRRFCEGAAKDERGLQMRWQSFLNAQYNGLLSKSAECAWREAEFDQCISDIDAAAGRSSIDREIAIETTHYLPNDILAKLDRASMSVSLEARTPFLDHELVEFLAAVPSRWKFRKFRGKHLLRIAMKDVLPSTIRSRRKQGFSMPIKRWLRADLFERVEQTFSSTSADLDGVLQPAVMHDLLLAHRAGIRDHSHMLWNLFTLIHWWEVVNRSVVQVSPSIVVTASGRKV